MEQHKKKSHKEGEKERKKEYIVIYAEKICGSIKFIYSTKIQKKKKISEGEKKKIHDTCLLLYKHI